MNSQVILIIAAIATVYIVLGILYESYVHPLTILSTLPSAGVGALLALELFNAPFSLIALIGIMLLIGIVKKNAIMMVDFALEAQRHGNLTPQEAIFTVYIVLGILYESYVHPLTILSTLPSAGVGALLALELFNAPFSLIALIGIMLLIGIEKKNAIMMVDFALEAQPHGKLTPQEAIFKACLLRFRPIMMTTMMTTLAALFGALPLVLSGGDGSELRQPLGITIVGGLVMSQLLTLYTTPVVYLFFDRLRLRFSRKP